MLGLRDNVLAAKDRLVAGHRELKRRHREGCPGVELCARASELRDAVLRELFETALADLGGRVPQIALVAHGGYGRRDVAPSSDIDLMILHAPSAATRVVPLARRLLRDVFDSGLVLGQSVRTPEQACNLALDDPMICTSLVESRLLTGDAELFEQFTERFRREVRGRIRTLVGSIERARRRERIRYGETVFLLEPNIKRSRGGLRDLHLIRWIGFTRYGSADPAELESLDVLGGEDRESLERAREFLLCLRNEMHFHAAETGDVLSRAEQLRVAEVRGYEGAAGLLPVEQFMRDYFRHTNAVSHLAARFCARAQSRDRLTRLVNSAFGHRVEGGVRVGPAGLLATRTGLEPLRGNLTEIMRLAALANLYDKPIAPPTWDVVRREAARLPDLLPGEACRRFLSLLDHPARLGPLLRDLHDIAVLQRFIPQFAHARGLLQFNLYHKYTVDEHCIRAVEFATELSSDRGPLGQVYRSIAQKRVLHLALLIHDLGKGFAEDHCRLGGKIAEQTAERLGMARREAEALKFLAENHLLMNHLAFRRDIGDEQLVVRFAVRVGSAELLRMLYVHTAADLGAVGPGVWDGWKSEILTNLYDRAVRHLAGHGPADTFGRRLEQRRREVRALLGSGRDASWYTRHLDTLPNAYLATSEPHQVADDLRLLRTVELGGAAATARCLAATETVQFTVATCQRISPGVFHKLTGALSAEGLQIRSARISTLADGLVLDRFWVHDPDFTGEPPPQRLEAVNRALVASLEAGRRGPPRFRRTWHAGGQGRAGGPAAQTHVNIDNTTSDDCTVLDIFAHDRPGLLYAVARSLFELGLSVTHARINTYLDQVVDVLYVTDHHGGKIEDETRLEAVRRRLLEVIESPEGD